MQPAQVVSILPRRDVFSSQSYGAVSLCVAELARYSTYRHDGMVMGEPCDHVLDPVIFRSVKRRGWLFQGRGKAYVNSCLAMLPPHKQYVVELHNRPQWLQYLSKEPFVQPLLFFHNDPLSMAASKSAEQRRYIIRYCGLVLCNSAYTKNRFMTGLELSDDEQKKIQVQYCGVDFDRYAPVDFGAKHRQIVFVGKLDPTKGALLALEAAKIVLSKYPDWKLVVVGKANRHEPSYAAAFHKLRAALGGRCQYHPFMAHEQVIDLFRASAIACLPSVWEEPFGRVVMEAMAMGCACISSNRGGIPEIVADTGVCLNDLSVASIAQDIEHIVAKDELRRDFQQRAQQRMRTHFDLKKQTALLDQRRQACMAQAMA